MKTIKIGLAIIAAATILATPAAYADSTGVGLSQAIESPLSKLSFQNSSGNDISDAHLNFPLRTARYVCQRDDMASKATLGTVSQKLFASIPDRSAYGWDVSIAPSDGAGATWLGSGGSAMRIDTASNQGCGSGFESSDKGGLLAVDTSTMVATDTCHWGCPDPILIGRGASSDFSQAASISLLNTDAPHIGWEGTFNDIKLRQTIPAGQPADDYQLPLTVTLTEL